MAVPKKVRRPAFELTLRSLLKPCRRGPHSPKGCNALLVLAPLLARADGALQ